MNPAGIPKPYWLRADGQSVVDHAAGVNAASLGGSSSWVRLSDSFVESLVREYIRDNGIPRD